MNAVERFIEAVSPVVSGGGSLDGVKAVEAAQCCAEVMGADRFRWSDLRALSQLLVGNEQEVRALLGFKMKYEETLRRLAS
jgi:hypothetical protein